MHTNSGMVTWLNEFFEKKVKREKEKYSQNARKVANHFFGSLQKHFGQACFKQMNPLFSLCLSG
jgi:hypothetical protein